MSGSFGTIVRRDIRATLGRFLAIVGIVALGCGFLAGLTMGGPDMRAAADRYDDGTHLWDLRLFSTLGFSDDDARRVAAIDGVDAVMPSIATDAMARIGGRQQAVRVSLLPEAAARSQTTCASAARRASAPSPKEATRRSAAGASPSSAPSARPTTPTP